MAANKHDLVIIGGGPGGYVAAIRAARLGLDTACVENAPALGGTCLRVGCIPSKALLESSERYWEAANEFNRHGIKIGQLELDLATMLKRKDGVVRTLTKGIDGLFKKYGVTRYEGVGSIPIAGRVRVEGKDAGELETTHTIIATGSKSATLPGVEFDGDRVGTSTEALSYTEAPKHLVVIGAGYIGLELGAVWRRLGSEVTVLEYLDRILPGMDSEMAAEAHKAFEKQGLAFQLSCKVTGVKTKKKGCEVAVEGADPIACDRVLVAVGRVPNTDGLGLDEAGVKRDDKGFVRVDERFQTNVKGVYAIGDVIGGPLLAHKAEEEGVACVEGIVKGYGHIDYDSIPGVVYTHPEIASVGRTEDQLREEGISYKKGVFPFMANGRARALNDTNGQVKILADEHSDRVLGVHIIGPRAGDLIAEAAVAMAFGASSEDLAYTSHAHPTLAEAIKEAALAVHDSQIHI